MLTRKKNDFVFRTKTSTNASEKQEPIIEEGKEERTNQEKHTNQKESITGFITKSIKKFFGKMLPIPYTNYQITVLNACFAFILNVLSIVLISLILSFIIKLVKK